MIAHCPNCGTGLDISGIPPGNAVACAACGKPFWIAGGAAPPPAPPPPVPVRPRQVPPPAGRPPSPPSRRPAPAAHAPARQHARPGRRRRPPGAKSPLPMVLAFGAVVAAGAGAVAWMAAKGSGGEAAAPGERAAAAPSETPPPAAPDPAPPPPPLSPLEAKAASAGMEVPAYLDHLVRRTAASPATARGIVESLRDLGRQGDAKRALDEGRRVHPHDPWLNDQLGLRDRTKEIQETAADETMQDLLGEFPAFIEVVKLKEGIVRVSGSGWLDDAGCRRLDGWLAACREQRDYLTDPLNARTHRLLVNLRYDQDFEKLSFSPVVRRPFIVFIEDDPEPARADAVRGSAERAAEALLGVYEPFLSFLRNDVGLGRAPRLEGLDDTRLRAFMFRSRRTFDLWHEAVGEKPPAKNVVAYYSPVRRMMIMHADMDWFTPSGVKGLPHDRAVCMHEGVHALYDWYQRWFCAESGKPIPEGQAILNPMRSSPDTLFWFQEGIADYFSAASPVPGRTGRWEPGQADRDHVEIIAAEASGDRAWKVEEFLFADQNDIYEAAREKGWGRESAGHLRALMYSHGWALTHFLLHGDEGKWRKPFLRYVAREIGGDHFRWRLEDLRRDLPEIGKLLEANPDLEYALKDRRDLALAFVGILQQVPELGRILRTRDLLSAFGVSDKEGREKALEAWMGEIQAGYGRHCEALRKGMGGK